MKHTQTRLLLRQRAASVFVHKLNPSIDENFVLMYAIVSFVWGFSVQCLVLVHPKCPLFGVHSQL